MVDPWLIERWAAAWARSRSLDPPRRIGEALHIIVGQPDQRARYVFPDPPRGIAEIAAGIDEPFVLLKAAISPDHMAAALSHLAPTGWTTTPPTAVSKTITPFVPSEVEGRAAGAARGVSTSLDTNGENGLENEQPGSTSAWHVERTGYFMTVAALPAEAAPVLEEYRLALSSQNGVTQAIITAADASLAARGRMTVIDGIAFFDQIRTEEAHGRRGLGTAVMRALAARAGEQGATRGALTATEAGRALYTRLGWTTAAPWTTAQRSAGLRP